MPFTAREQGLYDFAKGMLPGWFFQDQSRPEEILRAMVAVFDRVLANIEETRLRTLILQSAGVWLEMHAADRGTFRQDAETDAALRVRLRGVEAVVTRIAILAAAQAIVDADAIVGTVVGLELKRDKAFFGSNAARTGTGGTFVNSGVGSIFEFTTTVMFPLPIEVGFIRSGEQGNPRVTFASATSGGNNGTYTIVGLNGNAIRYVNGAGVAGADGAATWSIAQYDIEGNSRVGRKKSYFGRGYRMAGNLPLSFVIILPYGCTAATTAAVEEMALEKRAFGVAARVECRANP